MDPTLYPGRCYCGECNMSYLIPKGPIGSKHSRKYTWNLGGDRRVYAVCRNRSCQNILKVDHYIKPDGHVWSCVVCNGCFTHQYLRLQDWDPRRIKSRPSDRWENRCPHCRGIGSLYISSIQYQRGARLFPNAIIHPQGFDRERPGVIIGGDTACYVCSRHFPLENLIKNRQGGNHAH